LSHRRGEDGGASSTRESHSSPTISAADKLKSSLASSDEEPDPEFDVEIGDYCFRFRKEYARYFVDRASENGSSLVAISAELGIPFAVIKNWGQRIPTMGVALDLSRQNSQFYWEEIGRRNILNKHFNAVGWLKMMSVQYPQSWRELPGVISVESPDPYGFADKMVSEDVEVNTQIIFERLMRLKRDTG